MKKILSALIIPACMLTASCGREIGANTYESSAVGQVNSAKVGTIMSVRQIKVKTSEGGVGTLGGAVAGGAAGSMIGGSDAVHVIGAVGGALLGGLLGEAAQSGLSSQDAFEYVVRLDNGGVVTVTQGTDIIFNVGQKCIVLGASYGERARLVPYN